jgi:acetylglutamate kinase
MKLSEKIDMLNELVPNIKQYYGETVVIYLEGESLYSNDLASRFAEDVVLMKQLGVNVIVVHGGDQEIENTCKKFNIPLRYIDGARVMDQDSIRIAEMVLSGLVNKRIVSEINSAGGIAIGISGKDANLIEAKKYRSSKSSPNSNVESLIDFGFTGEPILVNPDMLFSLEDTDFIPIISPIAFGENHDTFHINALTAASIVVSSLAVRKFVIMTDKGGLVCDGKKIVEDLDYNTLLNIQRSGTADKEMEHIINTCVCTLENKIETIHVIDSKLPHSLALSIFTDTGCGTKINN